MLRSFIVMCFLCRHTEAKPGIVQEPEHQLLTDTEIEDMLSQYPELTETFNSLDLEYRRYIDEVGSVLISDPGMRDKLDSLDNNELSAGLLADELEKLKPELRSKLNEIKRAEVDRLLAQWQDYMKATGKPPEGITHLDTRNLHTFEVEDFRVLLKATVKDLNEVDKLRRQVFKEHEMKKRLEEEERLSKMNDTEREKFADSKKKLAKIHHEREKQVHHPGSEDQFKDVWENSDQMKDQEFDPNLFFLLHDLNNDKVLDEDEVMALFYREVATLYNKDDEDFDPAEKEEESELMREHYFEEADTNKDRLITFEEFKSHLDSRGHLKKEWSSLQDQPYFTMEEFEEYKRKKLAKKQETAESDKSKVPHTDAELPTPTPVQG